MERSKFKFKKMNINSYYTILVGKNEQYYFNLKASNHEIILQSEGYTTESSCRNGIESVQENCCISERYDRRISNDNKPYFVLLAGNGQTIGVSETYNSNQAMENGIESVMKNGKTTFIKDKKDKNPSSNEDKGETHIIINGKKVIWDKQKISFEEVVSIAFQKYESNPRIIYTVAYEDGPKQNVEGSMVRGENVCVTNNMIFHATVTDKS